MTGTTWQIAGRNPSGPLENDWREQLAKCLGYRPRRIGILAELSLYGALRCLDDAQALDDAQKGKLPGDVVLRICSMKGADTAIRQVLEQGRTELPMPFTFLQSQTSQILPALASVLDWQGDACVMAVREPADMAGLACRQSGRAGMLLGWVEEQPLRSDWLRLMPCDAPDAVFKPAADFFAMAAARYWRFGKSGIEIAAAD